MSDEVTNLLNEGRDLIKSGQRAKAADVLKQAVEIDPENVQVWELLSQALDDPDEKRIALTTILQLDPENTLAKEDLVKTESKQKDDRGNEEIVPGITRKQVRTTGLMLTAFTVVVLGIALLIVSSINGNIAAQRVQLTSEVLQVTDSVATGDANNTMVAMQDATSAFFATETSVALVSPTPTVTPTTRFVLPTPIPPTATATEVVSRIAPPPPPNLTGRIVGFGGRRLGGSEFLDVVTVSPTSGEVTIVNETLALSVTADDNYNNLVYLRQLGNTGYTLLTLGTENPDPILATDLYSEIFQIGGLTPTNPQMSRSGIAVVTSVVFDDLNVLYVITTADVVPTRITPEDGANYTAAAISPDGLSVVAVKTTASGTDLVLIAATDVANGFPQILLTQDGDSVVESFPSFSADGTTVVYSGYTTNPSDNDIYRAQLLNNAFAGNAVLVSTTADEIRPVLSPDGGYIVYANNASSMYNLFIFDVEGRQTFQLTDIEANIYPGSWATR